MKNIKSYNLEMKLLSGVVLALFTAVSIAQTPVAANEPQSQISASSTMRQISGRVVDASTGLPLVGVHVNAYNNTRYAAMTSEVGVFSINVPVYVTALTIESESYNAVVVPINAKTENVNVTLYADVFTPDYQLQTKATSQKTSTVTTMNADLSIDRQIQTGLGADVRTVIRSGQQGIGGIMLMNGINSLNANAQPLVVIDGVITDMQSNRSTIHDGFYNNILTNISVNDIEKVTVLKNGTALYGAKGGNGVILINTNRNKSYATKIDLDITGNFEMIPNLPPMMDAEDYRFYATELLGSTGLSLSNLKFLKSDPDYYYYNQYHNNTDWSKEVYREAFSQLYGINVQGGDERASYNLSVGYADANTTLKSFDLTRFNMRLNSDIILSDKMDIRFDASYSDINRDLRDDGTNSDIENSTVTSIGLLGLIKAPFLSPYQYDLSGTESSFLSDADDYLDEVLGTSASLANPAALIKYGEGINKNRFGNRLINLAISPVYRLNRRLTIKDHFSYSLTNTNANYYTPLTGMPSLVIQEVSTVDNVVKAMATHSNTFSNDLRLDWEKTIGADKMHFTGGFRYYNYAYESNIIVAYNTSNDKMPNINKDLSYKSSTGEDDKSLNMTYYALGDYNFKEKYFLSGGVSLEASSRFGQDVESGLSMFGVPWGIFPSIEGAWVVTSEPWFKPNNVINFLKVNTGYDISGNDDLDYTASRSYFGSVRLLNTINGLVLSNIGNTSLQWETTKRLTGGIEMNLFENRLNLTGNVFSSQTDDLLSLKQLSYLSGLDENWSNDGSLSNKGFDFSFRYKLLNTKPVKVEIGASVAHYSNEITALPSGSTSFTTEAYGGTIISQVGSPVGLFYGYKTDGVYSTTEEATTDGKYILLKNGQKKYFGAGDMNFVSDDALIDENDMTVIGDPNPDYYGNLFATITMKNVTLNAVFNYSVGNQIYNYQRMILEGGSTFYNQTIALNNRWTTEGQITDIPVATYNDPMGNSRFSDRWIEDGSYLRLKTITLSYAFPLRNQYIQGFTLWGSASNLWTLTNYLGSDPETSLSNNVLLQGIDRGLLPQGKSIALGIKINI